MRIPEDIKRSRCQLGAHVKTLRKEQELTQSQLGLLVGHDHSYISRIERGKCNAPLNTILLLADGLGTSPSELFSGIGRSRDAGFLPLDVFGESVGKKRDNE